MTCHVQGSLARPVGVVRALGVLLDGGHGGRHENGGRAGDAHGPVKGGKRLNGEHCLSTTKHPLVLVLLDGLLEQRQHGPVEEVRSDGIDLESRPHLLGRGPVGALIELDAGVVDQEIEAIVTHHIRPVSVSLFIGANLP